MTDLNPTLPRDLGRIVRRALVKDPTRRYQTAADLRNDLEELKASLDSGELQAPTMASGALLRGSGGPVTRNRGLAVAAGIVVLALAGGIYALKLRLAEPGASASATTTVSLQDLQVTQLTTSGNADRPVVSPDGKYVAYIQYAPGGGVAGSSVWIRQVATPSNVQIVAPEPSVNQWGLAITPDGSFVDYVRSMAGKPGRELWRVSFLGGGPKKLLEDVDTPIGWSPDGRHMAFVRILSTDRGSSALVVADADGGNPRVLAVRRRPAGFDLVVHYGKTERPAGLVA